MKTETFADVWDTIEDTPAKARSARLRSRIMTAIADAVRGWQVTQAEAARRLGITQPRLNQLLRGRMSLFSLGALTDLAMRAGIGVTVKLTPSRGAQAAARAKVATKAAKVVSGGPWKVRPPVPAKPAGKRM